VWKSTNVEGTRNTKGPALRRVCVARVCMYVSAGQQQIRRKRRQINELVLIGEKPIRSEPQKAGKSY